VSQALARKLLYTGFVTQAPAVRHPQALGENRILVSAGGGDVGAPLYTAAIEAAQLDTDLRWHLLIGGQDAAKKSAALQSRAPQTATIEPARADFRQMLCHARASVSMCGYNTALDVLQAGTPALFIPFDTGGEVEQTLRATALEKLDAIRVLKSDDLTGARMLAMVRELLAAPRRGPAALSMDGAAETVRLLADLVGKTEHAM
jgi:predicted glycosyltransferase